MTKKLVVTVFGTIILVVTVIMTISYINPNNKHKSNNDFLKQMNQNKKTKDDVKNKSDDSKTASDYKKNTYSGSSNSSNYRKNGSDTSSSSSNYRENNTGQDNSQKGSEIGPQMPSGKDIPSNENETEYKNIVVPYTGNANDQQVFNGEDALKQLKVQEGLLGDQNLIYDVFADDRGFYLIRVRDQTIIKQGGDGSVGIYRVYPTGVVSLQ